MEKNEKNRWCVGMSIRKTQPVLEFLLCRRPRKGSGSSFVFPVEHVFAGQITRTVVQLYREMKLDEAFECIKEKLGIEQNFSMLEHKLFIKTKDSTSELSSICNMFSQARQESDKIIIVRTSVVV
eukprot:GHVP01031272.1.p1 GENE.GHVP01031272.1~~GHVP01031272.1.p1  ORF type:complete len:125 (+),score=15.10 GHVP01031272.1:387-761(+)